MKPIGVEPRIIAARVLDAVLHRGRSLKAELATSLPQLSDTRDRALVEAICFAAIRQRHRYDAALKTWIPKPLPKKDDELRALLYVGFAQLDALGLSPHAAVAATVEAARALGRAHQVGLVNALLRRATRETFPAVDAVSVWPQWLQQRLRKAWPEQFANIIESSAQPAPLWLRVNRLRDTRDGYAQRLRELSIVVSTFDALPDALRIDEPIAVTDLPDFASGAVSVQDGAAQLVADALALPCGARVLDACAAPGGKAAHLLERDTSLVLTALDADAARLEKVRSTFARLGVGEQATLLATDATDPSNWWDGVLFDAILLDAPCSATGIVRRQPDVLLHRREHDLDSLIDMQTRLFDALWPLLKPGGVLLYATCSIMKCENETQVSNFLARTSDASAELLDVRFGRISGAGRQRLPGEDGMDGFFYARLRKH